MKYLFLLLFTFVVNGLTGAYDSHCDHDCHEAKAAYELPTPTSNTSPAKQCKDYCKNANLFFPQVQNWSCSSSQSERGLISDSHPPSWDNPEPFYPPKA